MDTTRKSSCPSPPGHQSQAHASTLPAQGATPPAQGHGLPPAQGTASTHVDGERYSRCAQWEYSFHTLNINSWSTFRPKLDDAAFVDLIGSSSILLLQEHKLVSTDETDSAVE